MFVHILFVYNKRVVFNKPRIRVQKTRKENSGKARGRLFCAFSKLWGVLLKNNN